MSLHKVSLCVCGLFFLLMERGKRKAECGPPNSDVDKYRQLRTGLFFGSFVSIWNHHESSFTCMIDSYLYVSQCVVQSDPPRFNYQYISINIYVVILKHRQGNKHSTSQSPTARDHSQSLPLSSSLSSFLFLSLSFSATLASPTPLACPEETRS